MENKKLKIIIDCDPGIDDALTIALALAHPHLEILGITTVAGNRELEKTTNNVLRTLEYFSRTQIPVYAGAEKPLVRELYKPADSSHGKDGLGNVSLPQPSLVAKGNAIEFVEETLMKYPKEVTILAIGPLTNIAKLVGVVDTSLIKQLYVMNGAFRVSGNATEYAEYNAFIDPDAARAVYSSGVPIKVAGLDVTNLVSITREEFENIKMISTPEARFFVMTHQWAMERKAKEGYSLFWDEVAFLWMVEDKFIKSKRGRVEVDVDGDVFGQTRFVEGVGNVEVGFSVDSEMFFRYLNNFLKSC